MLSQIDPTTKAKVLLEALPYLQNFKGETFVLKMGGAFMESEEARARVATDLIFLATVGINVIVVHGGGKAISRAMSSAGLEPVFKNGLRVTDAETVKLVAQTLDEEMNQRLCELLQVKHGRPLGIPGRQIFKCVKQTKDSEGNPVDLGFVGEVISTDKWKIRKAIEDGYTPIISPTAEDDQGQVYNTNADVAASHVAMAMNARRLVYFCDVPGLLQDPGDHNSLISTLYVDDVDNLKKSGVISSGMAPKVDSAVKALNAGVHRVHFIDGRMPHSCLLEIFTDEGIGTEIVNR